MEKFSQVIVNFICNNMTIEDKDMIEIYKYGIEITLSSLINLIMIILCSLILRDLIAGLIFMFCFVLLRSYTGGYHAEKYWRCNVVFLCTFLLTYFLARIFVQIELNLYGILIILFFSYIPILKFAPVKNIHKKLTEAKVKRSRKVSTVMYMIFFILTVLCYILNIWYGYMVLTTIISISIMIVIEIFMQNNGYHVSNT